MVVAALMASACTGDTTATTTTTGPDTSTTTSLAPTVPPGEPMAPPDVGPAEDVAAAALWAPDGWSEVTERDLFEDDAIVAIGLWLPDGLVAGSTSAVYSEGADRVVVVSVVPTMSWRGDPGLVPALAVMDGGDGGPSVDDGIYTLTTEAGLPIAVWSTGDGFLVASSLDREAATRLLGSREAARRPLEVWATGTCLYLDDAEGLPWAPIALERAVPCDGPHNAEVLEASQVAIASDGYDEDEISYQRNYECDAAYEEQLGPQRDRTPTLITYMPDEDEFDRGDRYLACVVQIETNEGTELFSGPITARTDLVWAPAAGECFTATLAPEGTPCSEPHAYQYLGTAIVDVDTWPASPAQAFEGACEPLLAGLEPGPAEVDAFPTGLYARAFERGDRTVRCMAFARSDEGIADVIGGFEGEWRVIGTGGIPA
jgi:hypothetical protein